LQARQLPLPNYVLLAETGDDHDKTFLVGCSLTEPPLSTDGAGSSRRAAEQRAAEAILDRLAAA
jgi:ribonuclease-3